MQLALAGEALPLWVSAARQTGGRGRAGRSWVSLPGNLHASVAVRSRAEARSAGQLALLAGVALFEAVLRACGPAAGARLRLKWPNDLLIGAAKIGGILVESSLLPYGEGMLAVAGFGLDVVASPGDLGRAATSLEAAGHPAHAGDVLLALAEQFQTWLEVWDDGHGFESVRRSWTERGGKPGEAISINTGSGPVHGTYRGLDERGALLVAVAGRFETFTYGDVALAGGGGIETGA